LFSKKGSKFKNNFRFDGELICNKPVPTIMVYIIILHNVEMNYWTNLFILQATQFKITYLPFAGPEEHIPGRKTIEQLVTHSNFSSYAFSFSKVIDN